MLCRQCDRPTLRHRQFLESRAYLSNDVAKTVDVSVENRKSSKAVSSPTTGDNTVTLRSAACSNSGAGIDTAMKTKLTRQTSNTQ